MVLSIINHGSLKQNKNLWEPILMDQQIWYHKWFLHTNVLITYIEQSILNIDPNGKNSNPQYYELQLMENI